MIRILTLEYPVCISGGLFGPRDSKPQETEIRNKKCRRLRTVKQRMSKNTRPRTSKDPKKQNYGRKTLLLYRF